MTDVYLGIDPGVHGAAACLDREGRVVCLADWPGDPVSATADLEGWMETWDIQAAGLETVNARPGISSKAMGGQQKNIGRWEGILAAKHIRLLSPTPQKWQKGLVLPSAGPDPKSRSLYVARRLFPDQINSLKRKSDHNRADALLIAEYTRRIVLKGDGGAE